MRLKEFDRSHDTPDSSISMDPHRGDYELRNYHKLDKYLSELCDLVEKGQESGKDFGMVAAGILPLKGNYMARLNRPGKDGRIHAEHAVIQDFIKKYGSIPEGSVIITTLSPCNKPMDERDGPSCADLLNDHGIQKVYCGYIDPTQNDGAEDNREYNLVETQDKGLRTRCEQFADTFLDKVNENFANYQGVRPPKNVPGTNLFLGQDIVGKRVYHCTNKLEAIKKSGGLKPRRDATGEREYGRLSTDEHPFIPVIGIWFSVGKPDWPSKHCVSFVIEPTDQVYVAYANTKGLKPNVVLNPIALDRLTVEGQQGVAENFADGKNPQDKGDAKRHGINTKASVSSLRKTAHQGGRKGQLAHWLANMKSGRAKKK